MVLMKKIFVLAAISLTVVSCSKINPNTEAAPLLEEARQAVVEQDFAKAHALIDSIRSAYPRATQVRWAALYFEDTINLEEAKYNYSAGVFYMDVISELERIGDFIINISQALVREEN